MPLTSRFQQVALSIEQAQALSRTAAQMAVKADPANTPWMPFNLFDFTALLFESVPLIGDGGRLLVVGAGPGPEMVIARDVFGMDVHGIEILEELALLGRDAGLPIETADALGWAGYGKFDAVWMNRPVRDRELEVVLERDVWDGMAPGAVAICANLESRPPENWFIVNDSWDNLRRGAWCKPHVATEGWA